MEEQNNIQKYDTTHQAIVLFDGHCNLCNGAVDFIIKRDKKAFFRFASLQSEIGQYFLEKHHTNNNKNIDKNLNKQEKNQNQEIEKDDAEKYKTIMVVYQNKIYQKSAAVFQITKRLSGVWFFLNIFQIIPTFFCDGVYDIIAKNRYRLFGKKNTCRIATPAEKIRFL